MNLSTIPCTLRNGRVRPVKREYWRLVMPGEVPGRETKDEACIGKHWYPCTYTPCHAPHLIHRRRVKVGKS